MRGGSIVEATLEAGYFDQSHLTRSLKRLIGQTPTDVRREGSLQLSFLYKTEPFASS
jgi:AraC-like DNA-binding protein